MVCEGGLGLWLQAGLAMTWQKTANLLGVAGGFGLGWGFGDLPLTRLSEETPNGCDIGVSLAGVMHSVQGGLGKNLVRMNLLG